MHISFARLFFLPVFFLITLVASAEDPPKLLGDYLIKDAATRGELVGVMPPKEMQKYMLKIQEAARANPEWFVEFNKELKDGLPIPFHENLGLTKEDYAHYLVLWGQREMKAVPDGEVPLVLTSPKEGEWVIRAGGAGSPLSLLRYDAKKDVLHSPNGVLKRLEDIAAGKESVLGEWTGHEWKYEEVGLLGKTKENFAIGKLASGDYGLLVYRLQEVSPEGRLEYDRKLLIRFPLKGK